MKLHFSLFGLIVLFLIIMITVSAATGAKLQFYNGNLSTASNTLYLNFNLVNTGTDPITLSNVKLRYYYTNDGTQSNSFACDWATAGSSNITGTFATITAVTGADRYFEARFASGAGTLAAGASTQVQIRVWKSDWSNFNQSNDYSFNTTSTSYTDWSKVTVYISDTLFWGTPASGESPVSTATPTPTPTITSSTPVPGSKPTVYLAGDSTVMTYNASYYPQAGWGQFIDDYFTTDVTFVNRAIGGRSSKTFIEDGRLDAILSVIQPNDYLFIQFGHNDASSNTTRHTDPYTTYKQYLKQYVDGARQHNAIPVLITPVARLHYVNGAFVNDFPDYCLAMKQVATENNVKLIDLMTKSLNYLTSIGYNEAYTMYMVSSNGTDYTHFTEKGASQMARLVAQRVKEIAVPLSQYVK